MEVWAAYSFLHKTDEKQLEDRFSLLPSHITDPVYRYRNPVDRAGRMISRILLETLIKKYLPYQGFSWNDYRRDDWSKPYLEGTSIRFSSSHHEEVSIVCISEKTECGIDSEPLREIDPYMYPDFLHDNEKEFLSVQQDPVRAFYEIWTRKESVLKASGLGVSCELNTIDAHAEVVSVNHRSYHTAPLCLPGNTVTHLATPGPVSKLHLEEMIL